MQDLARRLERLVRRRPAARARSSTRVFLHHCVEAGLDLAMVNPNHITPYAEISERGARARRRPRLQPPRGRARALHRALRVQGRGGGGRGGRPDRRHGARGGAALAHPAPQEGRRRGPDRRLGREDRRRPDAQRRAAAGHEGGRRQVRRRRADPAVRAAERRGHEARRRAAREVPRPASRATRRAPSCSRPCSATCTTSASRSSTRSSPTTATRSSTSASRSRSGRSSTPREEHKATAIGLSRAARLDLQADAAGRAGAAPARAGVPGADRRRGDQPQLRPPHPLPRAARESEDVYEPGVFYCKDAFEGLGVMDQLVEPRGARALLVEDPRRGARRCARRARSPRARRPTTTPCAPPRAPTCRSRTPPFWGVREIEVDLDEVYPHLDTHVLFKLHWGGRGVKGEAWEKLLEGDFLPRLERMWREQDYLQPRGAARLLPVRRATATSVVVFDPEDHEKVLETFVFPRQPGHDRLCLADFYRPKDSGERDVVALQAVTAGDEVTELMAQLEARRRVRRAAVRARPRRADRRGHGRVAALRDPQRPRHPARRRAAATRGATPPARSSPSTRSSSGCSAPSRSACAVAAATPSSPSSRRSRSSPTTRRPSTSA